MLEPYTPPSLEVKDQNKRGKRSQDIFKMLYHIEMMVVTVGERFISGSGGGACFSE